MLDEGGDPADLAAARETLRLAFVAALQHLPAKQRAVLILREVLRWQASEVAELLDTSVASVNSALQRARATLETSTSTRPTRRRSTAPTRSSACSSDYVEAFEAYDITALVALLRDDATFTMPPCPLWLQGPEAIVAFMHGTGAKCEGSKVLVTPANGGPARRSTTRPRTATFAPWAIVVHGDLGAQITGLHHYIYPELFAEFGLPPRLDAEHVGQADELQQPA